MLTISLENGGGELDKRRAKSAKEAAEIAAEMIRECGELYDGDKIIIIGNEEDIDA